MSKSVDDHFRDWESHVFGYGYGTGEAHVLPALKAFLGAIEPHGPYDYKALESACGSTIAWLLINILCGADIIDYGTSPRRGWLTKEGLALKEYVGAHHSDRLYNVVTEDEGYIRCYPHHCNCSDGRCINPFWQAKGDPQ